MKRERIKQYIKNLYKIACFFKISLKSEEEITELVLKLKSGEKLSTQEEYEILEFIKNIIRYHKYFNEQNAKLLGIELEDLELDVLAETWDYLPKFEPERGSLKSFIIQRIESLIRTWIRSSLQKEPPLALRVSFSDIITESLEKGQPLRYEDIIGYEDFEQEIEIVLEDLLENLEDHLTEIEAQILEKRLEGLPFELISEELNLPLEEVEKITSNLKEKVKNVLMTL